jgi:hypothetical protein
MDYERLVNKVAELEAKIEALTYIATATSNFSIKETSKEIHVQYANNKNLGTVIKKRREEDRKLNANTSDN